jgi:hypothetical protein
MTERGHDARSTPPTRRKRWFALAGAGLVTLTFAARARAALPASVEITRADEPIVTAPDTGAPRRGAGERGARLPVYAAGSGPGCGSGWFEVGPLAWVCADGASPSPLPPSGGNEPATDGLPFAYHFVGRDGSFGYRVLETAEEGVPDSQLLPGFGLAIMRVAVKPGASDAFGLTTHRVWVPLRDLGARVVPPAPLAAELAGGVSVAWVNVPRAALYERPAGPRKPGAFLEALARVDVLERVERGREAWLRVGDATWLRERDTTSPVVKAPPDEAAPDERWLDVDLARQMLVAYRGERPLFALPVSTGRGPAGTELATPPGVHRIWVKLRTSDMDNLEDPQASRIYAIQAVPWVMYFDRGYGLHGAFWHRAFGHVMSHGCVNVTPADAERLFAWTSPHLPAGWSAVLPTEYERGTLVRVE